VRVFGLMTPCFVELALPSHELGSHANDLEASQVQGEQTQRVLVERVGVLGQRMTAS
jgi:hypothetical protein